MDNLHSTVRLFVSLHGVLSFCIVLQINYHVHCACKFVQIETHMLNFQERAQSKCGTFDYLDHRPGGGDKKVFYTTLFHHTNGSKKKTN